MISPFIPVETFFNPIRAAEIWPDWLVKNEDFAKQIAQRKKLIQKLCGVLDSLPQADMHLEIAIKQRYISEVQAAYLYECLARLLADDDCKRLLLYLPFEFLPPTTWRPSEESLMAAIERFRDVYMNVWKRLLWVHDVRANFVDGDVLESECRDGDLPRVVKAAHLIPKLVEAGFMRVEDAFALYKESDDPILQASIEDALYGMGRLKNRQGIGRHEPNGTITKKREAWLKQVERQRTVDSLAETVCAAILENKFVNQQIDKEVLVEGIRKAVEKNPALYTGFEKTLLALLESEDPEVGEALFKAFRRFHRLGIIDADKLAELNIVVPQSAGPFSENLKLITELPAIQNMIMSTRLDPELSRLIYPIVLVYGSRLNGYGKQNADIDLAIFVRPQTPFSIQPTLRELFKNTFVHERIHGDEIMEFWLAEKEDQLKVRDLDGNTLIAKSSWVHVLFGAAWLGEEDSAQNLCRRLLVPYFAIHDHDARRLYLEEMERSFLQYRLMHNGYERFFPLCGGVHVPRPDAIDGKSMFWDSGYRQLATRLFASRVFLPKV